MAPCVLTITIRKYTSTGTQVGGWEITGLAGPQGIALDSTGHLYVSSYGGGFVSTFNGTSGGALPFTSPQWNGNFMPGGNGMPAVTAAIFS